MSEWTPATTDEVLIGQVQNVTGPKETLRGLGYRIHIDNGTQEVWILLRDVRHPWPHPGDHVAVHRIPRPEGIGYETEGMDTSPAYAVWRWTKAPYTQEGIWVLVGQPMAKYTPDELAHETGRPVEELRPEP